MTLLFVLAALVNTAGLAVGSLPRWMAAGLDWVSAFTAVFLGIFIEAAPFLLLGTIGSGVVEVFIQHEDVVRWIPKRPLLGALVGSLIGMFFPVCECGVVPFTRRLMSKGLPPAVGVATLLAAPVLNPIVIASTLAAFGPGLVFWGRLGLSLVVAVLTGWLFSLVKNPAELLRPGVIAPLQISIPDAPAQRLPLMERVRKALVISADEFFEMGRYLILGAMLAAAMQTFIHQSTLLRVGQGPVLSVLVMLALAVLLSICSTVDAFVALSFTGTFTIGAILSFLVFGPMVDIKSTLMFLRVFKPRAVAFLVLLPLGMILVATSLLNIFGRGGLF